MLHTQSFGHRFEYWIRCCVLLASCTAIDACPVRGRCCFRIATYHGQCRFVISFKRSPHLKNTRVERTRASNRIRAADFVAANRMLLFPF